MSCDDHDSCNDQMPLDASYWFCVPILQPLCASVLMDDTHNFLSGEYFGLLEELCPKHRKPGDWSTYVCGCGQ